MGSRLLVKTHSSRYGLDTDSEGSCRERELEIPTHLVFGRPRKDRVGTVREGRGGRQEGQGVGQEERVNSRRHRGVLQIRADRAPGVQRQNDH